MTGGVLARNGVGHELFLTVKGGHLKILVQKGDPVIAAEGSTLFLTRDTRWFLQSPLDPVFRAIYVLSRSRFVSVCLSVKMISGRNN